MISLFKLHFYYLFSWKVIYVSFILILISVVSSLVFSRFYLDIDMLIFNAEYYHKEYYFESINYFKFIIIIYNLFLVINAFAFNKYDLFLLARRSKKQVISSKIATLLIGSTSLITILYLIFIITGLYLTPYMRIASADLEIFFDLVIFGGVYLLIYIAVFLYSGSIYSLLLVIIGFFISDLTVDYDSLRSSASIMAKGINMIFISIGNYRNIGYSLFYGKTYGLILLVVLFVVISYKYRKSDF